jgi:putative copper export protein
MYFWAVFFHLIFVAFWLGGMLFTVAVLVPATRTKLKSNKGLIFKELGTRFSQLSWVIFALLLLTGILALIGKGFPAEALVSADFWSSGYGERLMYKLITFGLVLILSGIHDFWLGPKAADLMDSDPDKAETKWYRTASRWVGRINLLLGLLILFFAVGLVR